MQVKLDKVEKEIQVGKKQEYLHNIGDRLKNMYLFQRVKAKIAEYNSSDDTSELLDQQDADN